MKRVEQIRQYLEGESRRLHDELAVGNGFAAAGRREANSFGDRSEVATQTMELHQRNMVLQRARDQIARIERALEKIAAGTYGLCDSCGGAIPADRLEILPQTSLCLRCSSRRRA